MTYSISIFFTNEIGFTPYKFNYDNIDETIKGFGIRFWKFGISFSKTIYFGY